MSPGATPPRGRLRRSDCSGPGISRRRRGGGFSYLDPEGDRIRDEDTLERIRGLAIPPAWREVWICSDPYGHIQATGLDEAGRKQYLYHERWHLRAAQRKFESMREFAAKLPRLRRAVKKDLGREGMPRERALACAVRLLDLGFFRIGGEEYAETNESYGVATVLREHVSIEGEEVVFDFPAKSGQRRVQSIRDPAVKATIEAMRRRRSGPDDLLVFREDGAWRDVRSEEVNAYLQEKAGEEFSAKDFRTWHGTVLAAVELAREAAPTSRGGGERAIREAVKRVAERLGNTPAVCRSSYIDPRVLDRFRDGKTIDLQGLGEEDRVTPRRQGLIERRVLALIG
ncbi:MAG TPA: DNA topoisomerase IB [Solirubrobacterales bacterium]|nr:DNA topoisomerase IB [Solirubrobacterales bacterium]